MSRSPTKTNSNQVGLLGFGRCGFGIDRNVRGLLEQIEQHTELLVRSDCPIMLGGKTLRWRFKTECFRIRLLDLPIGSFGLGLRGCCMQEGVCQAAKPKLPKEFLEFRCFGHLSLQRLPTLSNRCVDS